MSSTTSAALNAGATRWENLGDWSEATDYADACRALATRLGRAARLGPTSAVFDVGCGWGEQVRHWREAFDVGQVIACEPSRERASWARRHGAQVINARLESLSSAEWPRVDAVLALDSAYHVDRDALLAGAARALQPGGRIAISTLTLREARPSPAARLLIGAASRACGLARGALRSTDDWRRALEAHGLTEVSLTVLDDPVLGGFAKHAGALRRPPRRVAATARLCALARRTGWLGYAVIAATRTSGRRATS